MFEVDLKSRKSIYEQVVDNLKELILIGVIAPDEKLPSVRELSKTLTINPNTVQKAFSELERQGYIYTASGVGTFASPKATIIPDQKLIDETKRRIAEEVRELYYLGFDADSIKETIRDIIEAQKLRMFDDGEREKS